MQTGISRLEMTLPAGNSASYDLLQHGHLATVMPQSLGVGRYLLACVGFERPAAAAG